MEKVQSPSEEKSRPTVGITKSPCYLGAPVKIMFSYFSTWPARLLQAAQAKKRAKIGAPAGVLDIAEYVGSN